MVTTEGWKGHVSRLDTGLIALNVRMVILTFILLLNIILRLLTIIQLSIVFRTTEVTYRGDVHTAHSLPI